MSKINTNKTNDFEPIRTGRQTDVRQAGKNETGSVENKKIVSSNDKLQFSNRAEEAGKLLDQLKELPDIREEKVSALRQQILAGEYSPSSEDIAAAILKDEE
jgi:negative regulator of flagellin synthesis FlgM